MDDNGTTPTDQFATIQDQPINPTTDRVAPNQVAAGVARSAQVIVGSSGVPQVLSGPQVKFGQGFYVSKPKVDVTTVTDANNFIFNSNQNVFKIVFTGSSLCPSLLLGSPGAGNYSSGTNNTVVPHGLSFVPLVIASGLYSSGIYSPFPITVNTGIAAHANWISYYVFADSTNIYFNTDLLTYGASATAASLSVKYWLLQETAN